MNSNCHLTNKSMNLTFNYSGIALEATMKSDSDANASKLKSLNKANCLTDYYEHIKDTQS